MCINVYEVLFLQDKFNKLQIINEVSLTRKYLSSMHRLLEMFKFFYQSRMFSKNKNSNFTI